MKYEYKKEKSIAYSQCDKKIRLGLTNVFELVEDMATEYYGSFKSDNITLKTKNNAAWVYSKISAHINKYPLWNQKVMCKSYTILHTKIKTRVENVVEDENGEILMVITQESCPIDLETRKIRKLESVSYPKDMEDKEKIGTNEFSRLTEKFDENDKIYTQVVQACDIDYTNHTNNVMYVKFLMNSFDSDFWKDKAVSDFEVHYLKESREKDKLEIYRKKISEKEYEFLIKRDETEIIKAKMVLTIE